MGVEPKSITLQATVLPLNYYRNMDTSTYKEFPDYRKYKRILLEESSCIFCHDTSNIVEQYNEAVDFMRRGNLSGAMIHGHSEAIALMALECDKQKCAEYGEYIIERCYFIGWNKLYHDVARRLLMEKSTINIKTIELLQTLYSMADYNGYKDVIISKFLTESIF